MQSSNVFDMAIASSYLEMINSDSDILEELHPMYSEIKQHIDEGDLMLSNRYYIDEDGISIPEPASLPHKDLLKQKVIILCNYHTASAGEDFIAYAKDTGRFVIIGTNTKGTTGQIARFTLPGGGTFLLSTKRCLTYDGQDIINTGISPDIYVSQSYSDLLNGVDTILNAAIEECHKEYDK